jgi:hypothetical protein
MVSGIGGANSGPDLLRAIEDLGRLLQQSQAEAMKTAEKLLRASVQQAVQDASVGARVDLTA